MLLKKANDAKGEDQRDFATQCDLFPLYATINKTYDPVLDATALCETALPEGCPNHQKNARYITAFILVAVYSHTS